jgi:phage gp36-like protein
VAYCTTADVELAAGGGERLIAACDWKREGVVDVAMVAHWIEVAGSEIDGGAAKLHATPLGDVAAVDVALQPPPLARARCAELAFLLLVEKRGKLTDDNGRRLEAVRTWIADVGAGRTTLGVSTVRSPMVVDQTVSTADGNGLEAEREASRQALGGAIW